MGAELGAITSIFPSDEATKKFLEAQGRGDVWAVSYTHLDVYKRQAFHFFGKNTISRTTKSAISVVAISG